MLILDTETLSPHERAEAYQAVVSGNASTSSAHFEPDVPVHAKAHLYELGPGRVFNVEATGHTLLRTPTMARRDEMTAVALALPLTGRNRFRSGDHDAILNRHDMLLVDMNRPYHYGWSGVGTSNAFQIDHDALGLSLDTVHTAAPRIAASPLYGFVRDHVRDLTVSAEQISDPGIAARAGEDAATLMRALIATAAGDRATAHSTRDAVLMLRVKDYVRRHLHDPQLNAQKIADEHYVSLRHLYALCERHQLRLERWILEQRLSGAKDQLVAPSSQSVRISDVAQAWGIHNASFFAARFRALYGLTPREWRQEHTAPHDRVD